MNILNYTNHTVTLYDRACCESKGRTTDEYKLKEAQPPVILNQIPVSGEPLSVHKIANTLHDPLCESIQLAHPLDYSMQLDPVPGTMDRDSIYIVSKRYAQFVSMYYYPLYADVFYYPDQLVVEEKNGIKRILGCLELRKAIPYQSPSTYLQAFNRNEFVSMNCIRCSIHYWSQRPYALQSLPYELDALEKLRTIIERR